MIHVRGLTKHYPNLRCGKLIALEDVNFNATPGQIYGLLGPNGAGKTTALRILAPVLRPTAGTVTINGCDVLTQPSEVRRQIGFMSANTAVYDRMTAWEMVEYSVACAAFRRSSAGGWRSSSSVCRCRRSATGWGRRCRPE